MAKRINRLADMNENIAAKAFNGGIRPNSTQTQMSLIKRMIVRKLNIIPMV